ncbi:signal peptidase I [Bacillus spongiae]|uniref:Signal peptidase I n=1 Tax=Bacillus spongiae TaxID=2683610 RepID=A0ABU8HF47_9BACI
MKKAIKVLGKMGSGALILLLVVLAVLVLSSRASGGEPTIFGHQVKVVLSGSMEPTFLTGSIIVNEVVNKEATYKKDDIITFQAEDKLITHRIIDVKKVGDQMMYETKGDHNNAPDSGYVVSANIVGKYTGMTIPNAGYIIQFATSKAGSALLLFIPGLLLVLSAVRTMVTALRDLEAKNA